MNTKRIKRMVRDNEVLYKLYEIYQFVLSLLFRLLWIFPVKNNRIVLQSYYGQYYNDNPKAVSDELKNADVELIWIIKNAKDFHDDDIRFVEYGSIRAAYYNSTAHIWIDNCRKMRYVRKRSNQYYIQLWHGNIGIKGAEKYVEDSLERDYVDRAKNDSKMTDLMVANSVWCKQMFERYYWYDGKIEIWGTARLDKVLNSSDEEKNNIRKNIGLTNERVVLYSPTFRNSDSLDAYQLDFYRLKKTLEAKTLDKWICLVRLHPNMFHLAEQLCDDNVINVTKYPDIYDLFKISDLVISDFSSNMLEAVSLMIPVVGYAEDFDNYVAKERKLLFKLEELPYIITKSNDELNQYLKDYDVETEKNNYKKFCDALKIIEDGMCSKRISKHIKSIINA